MAETKSTPSYSWDLHFQGNILGNVIVRLIMTISVKSSKIRDLQQLVEPVFRLSGI